jgi:hypothetical protein
VLARKKEMVTSSYLRKGTMRSTDDVQLDKKGLCMYSMNMLSILNKYSDTLNSVF